MGIVTQETVERAINKCLSKVKPWINLLLEEDPYIIYKIAILILLCIILGLLKKKEENPAPPVGGYKNFKGDTWYSNGWIWDEKTKKWKSPDYQNSKKPDENVSPSGWRWNEIEAIWEPPDIVIKENNERWRWDNVRGIWIDLNNEEK